MDGLKDLLLVGYLDRSNSKTKSVEKCAIRLDRDNSIKIVIDDNLAYNITKIFSQF